MNYTQYWRFSFLTILWKLSWNLPISLRHNTKSVTKASRNYHQVEAYFTSPKKRWPSSGTYYVSTMATASFSTLSPNKSVYRSGSTCSSWKMASTVTRKKTHTNMQSQPGHSQGPVLGCGHSEKHSPNPYLKSILYTHRGPLFKNSSDRQLHLLRDFSGLPLLIEKVWASCPHFL